MDAPQHGMTPEEIQAIRDRYGDGPHLAADLVVLTARWEQHRPDLRVLLIQRGNKPYRGRWALPGGFVDMDEDLEPAARRELREETGLTDLGTARVEQLGAFGHPDRDPRSRVVSVVHLAWVPWHALRAPEAGDDAAAARFMPIRGGVVQGDDGVALPLAFDHDQVLAKAWRRARLQAYHASAPLALAPEVFSDEQVAALYEAFTGPVDKVALLQRLRDNAWIAPAQGGSLWRAASDEISWERPGWVAPD